MATQFTVPPQCSVTCVDDSCSLVCPLATGSNSLTQNETTKEHSSMEKGTNFDYSCRTDGGVLMTDKKDPTRQYVLYKADGTDGSTDDSSHKHHDKKKHHKKDDEIFGFIMVIIVIAIVVGLIALAFGLLRKRRHHEKRGEYGGTRSLSNPTGAVSGDQEPGTPPRAGDAPLLGGDHNEFIYVNKFREGGRDDGYYGSYGNSNGLGAVFWIVLIILIFTPVFIIRK